MSNCVSCLLSLLCTALLTASGCSQHTPSSDSADPPHPPTAASSIKPDRQTPEACFLAFTEAWNGRDFDTAFDYLTPRAEEFIGAGYVVMIGLWQGMGTQEMLDSPFGQALDQLLRERGIDHLGWRFKHYLGDHEGDDDDRHVPALLATGRDLGPALEFTKALYAIDTQHHNEGRLEIFQHLYYGPMSDVEINDATALGWFGAPEMTGQLSVEFIRNEQGWLIDMIYPGPLEEPGGNQVRERSESF